MRHDRFRALALFFSGSLFLAAAIPAAEKLGVIDVEYKRDRNAAGPPSISKPAAGGLPPCLAIEAPAGSGEHGDVAAKPGLETRASIAATWAARQKIVVFGEREIHRAGFFEGLQAAFQDPLIGDWDHRRGVRAGLRDPNARRIGAHLGAREARRTSAENVYDLITTPAADRPATPALEPWIPPARQPRLLDVFDQIPLKTFLEHTGSEPLPDAWKLYRSDSYADFYDRRWADAEAAFEYWLDHHRGQAFWSDLEETQRSRFMEIFHHAFQHQLPELLSGTGEHAYGRGHDEGWSYAVAVVREWQYRKGYTRGFEIALQDHAESAFLDRYLNRLAKRYDERRPPSGSEETAPRWLGPASSAEPMEGLMP